MDVTVSRKRSGMRTKLRFQVISKLPGGRIAAMRSTNDLVLAWDWFTYYAGKDPLNAVTIEDREADVEATA